MADTLEQLRADIDHILALEKAELYNKPAKTLQSVADAPRIYPLVCIFGCSDPVVVVVHTPQGCLCAGNKYQPRCMEHLRKLDDTNEGEFTIVEDFRVGENWP